MYRRRGVGLDALPSFEVPRHEVVGRAVVFSLGIKRVKDRVYVYMSPGSYFLKNLDFLLTRHFLKVHTCTHLIINDLNFLKYP